jgi:pilus assembly protein CpaB
VRRGRKWSSASRSFLAIAVVLGAAAFLLVHGYAARVDALAPAIGPPVPVAVAARDLTRGATLTAETIRLREMPSAYAPPGALRSLDDAVGHTLLSDVAAGEAVTRTRIGSLRSGPLANLVPAGMRAVTVSVAVSPGEVRSGDHVDVLATFGGGQPHTETVGTGFEVIGLTTMDPRATIGTPADGAGSTLTLLVPPDGAEQLAFASAFADLSISVIGQEDRDTFST